MTFLAQLRCDELAAILPDRGLPEGETLVVFAGIEPDGGCPVSENAVLVELVGDNGLRRRPWPAAFADDRRLDAALAAPEPMLSPPTRRELAVMASDESVARFLAAIRPAGADHQLFGNGDTVQPVRLSQGHAVFLRLDSDALIGTSFGNGGSLIITLPVNVPFREGLKGARVGLDTT